MKKSVVIGVIVMASMVLSGCAVNQGKPHQKDYVTSLKAVNKAERKKDAAKKRMDTAVIMVGVTTADYGKKVKEYKEAKKSFEELYFGK